MYKRPGRCAAESHKQKRWVKQSHNKWHVVENPNTVCSSSPRWPGTLQLHGWSHHQGDTFDCTDAFHNRMLFHKFVCIPRPQQVEGHQQGEVDKAPCWYHLDLIQDVTMCLYSSMKAFIVHCTGNSMASQNIWCMWWLRAQLVVLKQVLKQDKLRYDIAAKVLCPRSLLLELDCWFPDDAGKFAGICRPPQQDPVLATCRWRLANVVHHAGTPHCQSNTAPALPLTVPLSCGSFHLLFPRIQSSCAHCSWPRTRSQFGSPRPGTCQSCWPLASHQAVNLTQAKQL